MRPQNIGFDPPGNLDTATNADGMRIFKQRGKGSTDTLSEGDEDCDADGSPSENPTSMNGESAPPTATSMSASAKTLLRNINNSKPSNTSTSADVATPHETPDVAVNASQPTSTPQDANVAPGTSPEQNGQDDNVSETDSDDLFIGGQDEPHVRGPVMTDSSPEPQSSMGSPHTDSVTGLAVRGGRKKALNEIAKDEDELSIASLIEANEDTSKMSPEELEQRLERL
jgi:hypothetical protein